jgi:hypothetical protein
MCSLKEDSRRLMLASILNEAALKRDFRTYELNYTAAWCQI